MAAITNFYCSIVPVINMMVDKLPILKIITADFALFLFSLNPKTSLSLPHLLNKPYCPLKDQKFPAPIS